MATRQEIEQSYYVPAFWEASLEGFSDWEEDEDSDVMVSVFRLSDADRAEWPELGNATELRVWEDSYGFVYARTTGAT